MLTLKPGVIEAADRALAAAEKLGSVPETIDALITKGTFLGQLGRLSESRIILEGAIALAEEHDLGRSIARGQHNLGYVLFGLDDSASLALSRRRLSNRTTSRRSLQFVLSRWPDGPGLAAIGDFEKAEEVLANPLTKDQPPAARVIIANAELTIAAWRGELERVERLDAEVTRLMADVDDPQIQTPSAMSGSTGGPSQRRARNGILCRQAVSRCRPGTRSPRRSVDPVVHCASRRGLTLRYVDSLCSAAFCPAYRDHHTTCQVLAPAVDGPVDTREIDAVIARRAGWGSVADVVRFSIIAAPFAIPEKRNEYVSTARSIATERGWHGILKLIDAHLS